jgi:hypothetical protein
VLFIQAMKPKKMLSTILLLSFGAACLLADIAGTWSSGSNYNSGDLVIYNGTTYQAQQTISNSQIAPASDASAWQSLDQIAAGKPDPNDQPSTTPDSDSSSDLADGEERINDNLGDWYYISWFGKFYDATGGWVYNGTHGWLYVSSSSAGNFWFYDDELGWFWTGLNKYPYVYSSTHAQWLYLDSENGQRKFYLYEDGKWLNLSSPDASDLLRAWSPGSNYQPGELVIHNGKTYQALQSISNSQTSPDSDSSGWTSLDQIASSKSNPAGQPSIIPNTNSLPSPPESNGNSTIVTRFLGISTRGSISSSKGMYSGIAITGTGKKKVAFMGKGKTMAAHGVSDYAQDPKLVIYKLENGAWSIHRTIDNWIDASGSERITTVAGKAGITLPVDDKEAAIVLELEAGNYTTILTSKETQMKEALIEAYEIAD